MYISHNNFYIWGQCFQWGAVADTGGGAELRTPLTDFEAKNVPSLMHRMCIPFSSYSII